MLEPTAKICKELKNLIDSSETQDELECRKYLGYAEEFLFKKDTLKERLYSERELPMYTGKTDYVISGIIGNNPYFDPKCVKAYVWEFKAPQCYVFRKETENRLCPTKELFEAENQLLNYYHALKYNLTLVDRFKAGHPKNVFIGGIIIGSSERLVKGELEEEKKKEMLKEAYDIRKSYFYDQTDLYLVTWSDVLDYLNKKYVNLTKDSIDPKHTFKASRLTERTISGEAIIKEVKS